MRWAVSFVAFVVLAAPVFASGPAAEPDQPKGIGRTPSRNVGVDVAAIESVYAEIANDPHRDLEGVVILRDGRVVSEATSTAMMLQQCTIFGPPRKVLPRC